MFVPLHDVNTLKHVPFQFVTIGLIVVNVLVFMLFQSGILFPATNAFAYSFGMIPAVVTDARDLAPELAVWSDSLEPMTLITYQFLHGGWVHLISNLLFLWVFGDNIEDALGHFKFLVFYLACGVVAGLAHMLAMPGSEMPLIGASGAVAGVIGAYLVLHPRVKVWVLVLWGIPLRLNAMIVLGVWFAMQIVNVILAGDESVAWWAHIGGFIAGAILVIPLRRHGVALFDRDLAM